MPPKMGRTKKMMRDMTSSFCICFSANFSEETVETFPSDIPTGIYYGWASVANGDVHKMVLSIGWNPYYKNVKKSVVRTSVLTSLWDIVVLSSRNLFGEFPFQSCLDGEYENLSLGFLLIVSQGCPVCAFVHVFPSSVSVVLSGKLLSNRCRSCADNYFQT